MLNEIECIHKIFYEAIKKDKNVKTQNEKSTSIRLIYFYH